MIQQISVLVSARKNSKYLAKFLFGYMQNTSDLNNIELLVMLNANDTWNLELMEYFLDSGHNIRFFTEDLGLGRGGLHEYFNILAKSSSGHWIVYFCEDHFISMPGWDSYVRNTIFDKKLDPRDIWCLIPKFDNVGAMNQIISRGYYNAMGETLGRHGNIDSYINDVNLGAFGIDPDRKSDDNRVVRFDDEMFHDFTHDKPNPLDDINTKTELSDEGKELPPYTSLIVQHWIKEDAKKIRSAL